MGIKAAIHRFVLWAPVALASGYIGVFAGPQQPPHLIYASEDLSITKLQCCIV